MESLFKNLFHTGRAGKLLLCWKVITFAGVPHMGCHEMWVCPAFWPHFTEKVKQYIEKIQQKRCLRQRPKGAGASRRPPWVFVVFFQCIA